MSQTVTYSPREGVIYTGTYIVKHGMAYVTAQGHTGIPVAIGGLTKEWAATEAIKGMIGKFGLKPDSAVA